MKKLLAFGFMCTMLLVGQIANAQSDNLKGVSGVVLFISVDKALTDAGVDRNSISTSVELKMRNVGLTVFTLDHKATPEEVAAQPKLKLVIISVTLRGMKILDTSTYCYSYSIIVNEQAMMKHAPSIYASVITWSTMSLGYFGLDRADSVKTNVSDAADIFCNDYLVANPKPSLVPMAP